jgi:hypothetical protein
LSNRISNAIANLGERQLALKLAFAQSDRVIKTILPVIAAVGLCGCASAGGTGTIPHLSDHRCQLLVTQADRMAMAGGPLPDEIQRLNPVQVYGDHGNIVIALQRNSQGEQGFYIVPTTSSYDPALRPHPDWTFTLVNPNDSYVNNLYQYSRIWRH